MDNDLFYRRLDAERDRQRDQQEQLERERNERWQRQQDEDQRERERNERWQHHQDEIDRQEREKLQSALARVEAEHRQKWDQDWQDQQQRSLAQRFWGWFGFDDQDKDQNKPPRNAGKAAPGRPSGRGRRPSGRRR